MSDSRPGFGDEGDPFIEKLGAVVKTANSIGALVEQGELKVPLSGSEEAMLHFAAILLSQGRTNDDPLDLTPLHGSAFASGYLLAKMEEVAQEELDHPLRGDPAGSATRAVVKVAIRYGVLPVAYEVGDGPDPDIKEVKG